MCDTLDWLYYANSKAKINCHLSYHHWFVWNPEYQFFAALLRGGHLSRPRWPFWGPLAAILDSAGGAAFQAVQHCRQWAIAPGTARLVLFTTYHITDIEKHPNILAALAEIFLGFGGNIFQWFPLFYDAFGRKQKKLDIVWQIHLLFNQKLLKLSCTIDYVKRSMINKRGF